MVYTLEEKYQIVVWSHNGFSENQIKEAFAQMFQNRPAPSALTIRKIMHNLQTNGCLTPGQHKIERAPRPVNPDRELRDILICASVEQNPQQSSYQLAREFDLTPKRTRQILKKMGTGVLN